jgi:hypothetical protein
MGGKSYRNSKKEREQEQRKAHKQQKKRKREVIMLERPEPKLSESEKILIVCEGINTEKSYFDAFKKMLRLTGVTVEIIPAPVGIKPRGTDPKTIVNKAKKLRDLEEKTEEPYSQVWCVFDHDPSPESPQKSENFNNFVAKARSLGFGVAYSNQGFEYWLLLHFEHHLGEPMHRDLYADKINLHLAQHKLKYDKDKIITSEIFEVLQAIDADTGKMRQTLATERAKKILEKWTKEDESRTNPAKEESSTTVFELVETLVALQI